MSDNVPSYLDDLTRATLESLQMLKREKEEKDFLEADMWCHFGTAIIRGPGEGNIPFMTFIASYSDETTRTAFSCKEFRN